MEGHQLRRYAIADSSPRERRLHGLSLQTCSNLFRMRTNSRAAGCSPYFNESFYPMLLPCHSVGAI